MKLRFILNPVSGRHGRAGLLVDDVRRFIAKGRLDADLAITTGPGHATELAREAVKSGCERVVAVGGDGTMNEVAQALLHTPVALALVPCGSGNGLSLHLGLPMAPAAALALAASAHARIVLIDTGSVNGLPFFNAMGLGLDADIAQRFNQLKTRGLAAYVVTAWKAFRHRRTEHCLVTCGGRREAIDALLIAVANSDQYGNQARIAPGARVDDGVMDLIALRPIGLFTATTLAWRLFRGSFDRSPVVRRLQSARFLIERPAAGLVHTDGDTHATSGSLSIVVHPRSLHLVVPPNCAVLAAANERKPEGFALHVP